MTPPPQPNASSHSNIIILRFPHVWRRIKNDLIKCETKKKNRKTVRPIVRAESSKTDENTDWIIIVYVRVHC